MPPRSRFALSLTSRTLVAGFAGVLAGGLLAAQPPSFGSQFILHVVVLLAHIALATGQCLALPLIFASIITGADTLENMRGVGRLTLKTGAWIAGSSALAVLTGLVVGLIFRPANGAVSPSGTSIDRCPIWDNSFPGEIWIAGVLVALALGVYRNQIEETRARLLMRFALAIDETLSLLLAWAAGLIPVAVFCVAAASAAVFPPDLADVRRFSGLLWALAVGWSIYGLLLLPLILLAFARLNPWRYALAVGPAVLAALAGASPAQVFPLTLARVRGRAGVSNRVSSLALSGCTALLRDGQALGWAVAAAWLVPSATHPAQCLQIFVAEWLAGCAAVAIMGRAAPMMIFIGASHSVLLEGKLAVLMVALISLVGNAVGVFSQTCAAAVIARSEGETNLLPPLPPNQSLADVLLETSAL